MKPVRGEKDHRKFNQMVAAEIEAGTLSFNGCSQEADDVCQGHGGCQFEGETVILCEDGESFIKAA